MSLPTSQRAFAILLAVGLTHCSGDQKAPPTQRTLTGQLVGPLVGVTFESPSHNGTTDANGHFTYESNETVRFLVGTTVLGELKGQASVSLFDLAKAIPLTGNELTEAVLNWSEAPELHAALNLAIFLQTLDADGDASNGIEISGSMAGLLAGPSVRFSGPYVDFRTNFVFRGALNAANANHLFSPVRHVQRPWLAMQYLYDSVGVQPAVFGRTSTAEDYNADHVADVISAWAYDSTGFRTSYSRDYDGLGVDDVRTYLWDARGNPVGESYDSDMDTVPNATITRTFDADDNKLSESRDTDANGTPDGVDTYTYDDTGRVLQAVYDSNGDGVPESIMTHEYDTAGNRTKTLFDTNGDSVPDSIDSYTYDATGNILTRSTDGDANGTPEQRWTYAYDAAGRQQSVAYDAGADGTPESIVSFTYDLDGNRTREAYDAGADGVDDDVTTYTYDAAGHLTGVGYDYDGNGTADELETLTYDNDGRLLMHGWDYDANQAFDEIETHTYDDTAGTMTIEYDTDGNGSPESIVIHTYDADGNDILIATDQNADSVVDRLTTRTYQATGLPWVFLSQL